MRRWQRAPRRWVHCVCGQKEPHGDRNQRWGRVFSLSVLPQGSLLQHRPTGNGLGVLQRLVQNYKRSSGVNAPHAGLRSRLVSAPEPWLSRRQLGWGTSSLPPAPCPGSRCPGWPRNSFRILRQTATAKAIPSNHTRPLWPWCCLFLKYDSGKYVERHFKTPDFILRIPTRWTNPVAGGQVDGWSWAFLTVGVSDEACLTLRVSVFFKMEMRWSMTPPWFWFFIFIKKCSSHLKLKQNKNADGPLASSLHFMERALPKARLT